MTMRSVADELSSEPRLGREATAEENIAQAMALGERGLETFCVARGLDRQTAIRILERQRQRGRRHSHALDEIIG